MTCDIISNGRLYSKNIKAQYDIVDQQRVFNSMNTITTKRQDCLESKVVLFRSPISHVRLYESKQTACKHN